MPEPSVPRLLPVPLLVLVVLLLAACSDTSGSSGEAAPPSEASPDFVLVAIGDSIPYNLESDCPGCTGFVDSYAAALEDELGETVTAINRSRHDGAQTIDIVEQLRSDDDLLAELATAEVVVMSVGFNDQPPFADAHDGCPEPVTETDPLSTAIERAAATSHDCIDTVVQAVRDQIAEVFAGVREQAPDAAIGALTAYDTWLGWSELDAAETGTRNKLYAAERYWMHEWRDAMCEEAAAVGAVCVDVYTAFNGPDGDQPAADFVVAADYTHPSQKGNDVIRDLLIEAKLTGS
jgi:lysophospholipase L1-like esterase